MADCGKRSKSGSPGSTRLSSQRSRDGLASLSTAGSWSCHGVITVELLSLSGLCRPAPRGLDVLRRGCSQLSGHAAEHRVYVEVAALGRRGAPVARSPIFEAVEGDAVDFGGCRLEVPAEELWAASSSASASASAGGGFLDEPFGRLAVRLRAARGRRGLLGDPLVGEGILEVAQPCLLLALGQRPERLPLQRRRRGRGQLALRVGMQLPDEVVLGVPHGVPTQPIYCAVAALVDCFEPEEAVALALAARPAALAAWPEGEAVHEKVRSLLAAFRRQAALLRPGARHEEVLRQLGRFAFNVLGFVRGGLGAAGEGEAGGWRAEGLAAEWIRAIFRLGWAHGSGFAERCPRMCEAQLQQFLHAGRQFPTLEDIVPVTAAQVPVPDFRGWLEQEPPAASKLRGGAHGTVYRALDLRRGGVRAVKVASSRSGLRECEMVEHLLMAAHPCLVQLLGAFWSEQRAVVVMEFCEEGDLHDAICRRSRPQYRPPRQAAQWFGQVFLALEHLHLTLEVLVRDLKPENVLIAGGRAKVADFGHSRVGLLCSGRSSFCHAPAGSPEYAAPEVVASRPYSYQADLYSLGVVLWVLLTGGLKEHPACAPCVAPPRGQPAGDYGYLARNCHLLRRHVLEPRLFGVKAMPCRASRRLVLWLLEERPERRPEHDEIREEAWLRPLRLPRSEPGEELDRWLAALDA